MTTPDPHQNRGSPPSEWVQQHAHRIRAGGLVLDLACGAGRHTRYLIEQAFSVVAADIDIALLGDVALHPHVTTLAIDLETGPWPFEDDRFDGIIVVTYLYRGHLPHLVRSLTPGGVLIFDTFAVGNEAYGRPRNPDHLLQRDELKDYYADTLTEIAYEHGKIERPGSAIKQRYCGQLTSRARSTNPSSYE